jgi:hypothetical protein
MAAGTLYQTKHAFYWWNALFIKEFSTIYHRWYVGLMKWIHQVATEFSLSSVFFKKNSLADTELPMLFRVVLDSTTGAQNLEQQYTAWNLAWMAGACPGSITVGRRSAANDPLPNGQPRQIDETLQWSDIAWSKDNRSVRFRLKTRCVKGSCDPHRVGIVTLSGHFFPAPTFGAPRTRPRSDPSGIAFNLGLSQIDYVLNTNAL